MSNSSLKIINGRIITPYRIIPNGSLLISEGVITALSETIIDSPASKTNQIALITDAMRAAGMPPGESILGSLQNGLKVIVEDGVAKLPDRSSFAGSVATQTGW